VSAIGRARCDPGPGAFHCENSRKLHLRLSQNGLADLPGVTRHSTHRELKQMEREGLIRVGASEIEALDLAGLGVVSNESC
jgi:CRP-like cAMP-binding protein